MKPFLAPLSGKVLPLANVPDEVFASRMLGDGFAVEPVSGDVYAPFDGEVAALPSTFHAIGLRSEEGLEVLIHIGIDSVNMNGEGFTSHVSQGDRVRAGQLLLTFDLSVLANRAVSALSPVVVTGGAFPGPLPQEGQVAAGQPLPGGPDESLSPCLK
ncbi:MAG: PTS glucose transporter subunit IIA [Armatimonadetes bacterium]|nr:PTS glucose transporter subunit IIA [Armatimonadota bacterium]